MKDFRTEFKTLATVKTLLSWDIAARAIRIGMETESPVKTAKQILSRAFTPVSRKLKLDNGFQPNRGVAAALEGSHFSNLADCLDINKFKTIQKELVDFYQPPSSVQHTRYYTYIFVRQDIFPEYQAVQACHAAAKMGHYCHQHCTNLNFDELYFALIGVPDLKAMAVAMADCAEVGATVYPFYEPDIGNELTAFGTTPILMANRKRLLSYKKLKFNFGG